MLEELYSLFANEEAFKYLLRKLRYISLCGKDAAKLYIRATYYTLRRHLSTGESAAAATVERRQSFREERQRSRVQRGEGPHPGFVRDDSAAESQAQAESRTSPQRRQIATEPRVDAVGSPLAAIRFTQNA